MFELRISKKAEKQIKKIKKVYQTAILDALAEIKDDPNLGKPLERELNKRFTHKVGGYIIEWSKSLPGMISKACESFAPLMIDCHQSGYAVLNEYGYSNRLVEQVINVGKNSTA